MLCEDCQSVMYKTYYIHDKTLCRNCYQRYHRYTDNFHTPPPAGEVRYSAKGNPICHICGMAYSKLMLHVEQIHHITALEYKTQFKLNKRRGLISAKTLTKLKKAVDMELVEENLLKKGEGTRFKSKKVWV